MTDAVQVFNNPEFGEIRTIMLDDEAWFVGKDVAGALGYKNPQKTVRDHVDVEDRTVNDSFTVNGTAVTLINESGLYSLILSSKLPSAKKFKRWVTSEVLPAIRKTGRYEMPQPEPETTNQRQLTVDDYIRAASIVAGCRNERMPTVLALLEKSGISTPLLEDVQKISQNGPEYEQTGATAALINRVVNEYGLDENRLARLCGMQPDQFTRIRKGIEKPRKDKAVVIRAIIAQSEIDASFAKRKRIYDD